MLSKIFQSCICAIPSVCTSGMSLASANFKLQRKYFLYLFSIRFFFSCVLSTIALVEDGNMDQLLVIVTTMTISLIGAFRVHYLINVEADSFSFDVNLMASKLQDDK